MPICFLCFSHSSFCWTHAHAMSNTMPQDPREVAEAEARYVWIEKLNNELVKKFMRAFQAKIYSGRRSPLRVHFTELIKYWTTILKGMQKVDAATSPFVGICCGALICTHASMVLPPVPFTEKFGGGIAFTDADLHRDPPLSPEVQRFKDKYDDKLVVDAMQRQVCTCMCVVCDFVAIVSIVFIALRCRAWMTAQIAKLPDSASADDIHDLEIAKEQLQNAQYWNIQQWVNGDGGELEHWEVDFTDLCEDIDDKLKIMRTNLEKSVAEVTEGTVPAREVVEFM